MLSSICNMAVNLIYESIPVIALRGIVIFPGMRFHFDVGRKQSIAAVKAAMNDSQKILLVTQKDIKVDEPDFEDLYSIGVVAKINQVIKSPDSDSLRVVVEGISRAVITTELSSRPYMLCDVKVKKSSRIKAEEADLKEALIHKVKDAYEVYLQYSTPEPNEAVAAIFFSDDADFVADSVSGNLMLRYQERQQLLSELNIIKRLEKLYSIIVRENRILSIERSVEERVESQMDQNQKEYYLKEKLKAISTELGDGEDTLSDVQKYKEKIQALKCSDEIRAKLIKECEKLSKMQGISVDASILRGYLDTVVELPFGVYSEDSFDLVKAKSILERDHYGLKNVKERFIELLAVKKMTDNVRGQIICLVGPPGIGKTSIVRSVAECMNRKYVRLSLGGVSDEAEIRGHRKTYVGAMPGRIVSAVNQAKTMNPVVLLDEIDKLGKDYKGDPASALLEVLDPEQNSTFRDNYLELPLDLSKILFITTANDPSTIPPALYDRMEVIELTSYSPEEKFMIAKNHLCKKQVLQHGLNGRLIRFTDDAIKYIIEHYTSEAGVRKLEQVIAKICRKAVVKINESSIKRFTVTVEAVEDLLGPAVYKADKILSKDTVGVVNGLAWTSVGGDLLQVEAVSMPGEGKIELTGSLGDVMKESALAAFSYIKANAESFSLDSSLFSKINLHIHVPQGAVPKDGPSAGVTIATAILSCLTSRRVDRLVAMTGETTLTGRVLPIGGLKEKSMAAYKAGITKVIIPEDNFSDLWKIEDVVKSNVQFIPVSTLKEVFELALKDKPEDKTHSNVKISPHDITATVITERKVKHDEVR